ncbi:MAG: SprB repeat-containing protein [Flavobacteriales bacterium]|nr:SprB repeat-containing protein [Flavobacteriales bacterium]
MLVFTVNTLTEASCADAADGAIATTAFGGVPSYTFNWTGPTASTRSRRISPASFLATTPFPCPTPMDAPSTP